MRRGLPIVTLLLGLTLPAAGAESVGRIARELSQATPSQVPGIVTRLARIGTPRAFDLILKAAVTYPSTKTADGARKAIAGAGDKALSSLIRTLERVSVSYVARQLILQGFALRRDDRSWEAIVGRLKDKVVHVRSAAIQAIADRKERRGVPVLIDFLAEAMKARDRDWLDAREALLRLTGHDFQAIEDWRNFWELNKNTLDPKKIGEEKGRTRVRLAKPREDAPTFFGVEIISHNVLFVIDMSGSMRLYDIPENPDPNENPEDRKRITRAKGQLLQAIGNLRRGSRYNILAFSDRNVEWQKKMVPATRGAFSRAKKFVLSLQPNGWTHTDEAFERAFQIPFVDTIVLLSDGAPMKGSRGPVAPGPSQGPQELIPKILARVRELNAIRKIKIFTFGFEGAGSEEPDGAPQPGENAIAQMFSKFMRDLAEQNGGEYKPIR